MPTSVRSDTPKDVFVVHSKSEGVHAAIVERLVAGMKALGRSVWDYSDWDWEAEREGRVGYHWSGRVDQLDPVRHQAQQPPFRKREKFKEVDKESIDELMERTSVVLLLAPASGELSEGSAIEVERIAALFAEEAADQRVTLRPLIIEAGWSGDSPPGFAALNPALRLTLSPDTRHEAVRLTGLCFGASVVHTLQTRYRIPGHHLLSRAASENYIVDRLVSGSPHHRILEFLELEERSRRHERELAKMPDSPAVRMEDTRPGMVSMPNAEDMGGFMRRMELEISPVLGSERFSKFLDTDIMPFRAWFDAQTDNSEERFAVRSLLQTIISNWEESFKRFEWAETLFESVTRK